MEVMSSVFQSVPEGASLFATADPCFFLAFLPWILSCRAPEPIPLVAVQLQVVDAEEKTGIFASRNRPLLWLGAQGIGVLLGEAKCSNWREGDFFGGGGGREDRGLSTLCGLVQGGSVC